MADNGAMAAVFGPLAEIERVVDSIDGNVVIANINSNSQAVIGGATDGRRAAPSRRFQAAGVNAVRIPVSHAFHTSIVAPATRAAEGRPCAGSTCARRRCRSSSNVTGDFYPADADNEIMLDLLGRQVASPVQFVRGLHTLYDAGARVFVEVGPKKALHGFVEDVLGEHDDVLALFTNHPKNGDVAAFNAALCGLWAAGSATPPATVPTGTAVPSRRPRAAPGRPDHDPGRRAAAGSVTERPHSKGSTMTHDQYVELGRVFADALEQGLRIAGVGRAPRCRRRARPRRPSRWSSPARPSGCPASTHVFDDENLQRILDGQQFIDTIPHRFRQQMVDMHITRLVKRESGDPTFEAIDDEADVVKLAGRHAPLDVVARVRRRRRPATRRSTRVTRLAIGAGFDAHARRRAAAGHALQDHDARLEAARALGPARRPARRHRRDLRLGLPGLRLLRRRPRPLLHRPRTPRAAARPRGGPGPDARRRAPRCAEVDRRIAELRHLLEVEPFTFDRRFLFRAPVDGALPVRRDHRRSRTRTPRSTRRAPAPPRRCRWPRTGSGPAGAAAWSWSPPTTSPATTLLPWVASGFLASGAAATDDSVEDAATPFDRRRHGMIVGMGAAAFVVESAEAARERGLQPICEVLGAVTANSAFHGTRLDVDHIAQVMEDVVGAGGAPRGRPARDRRVDRLRLARDVHPGARRQRRRGDQRAAVRPSAPDAGSIVITNTKGFTGHAMGAGIEDVVAIKALETGDRAAGAELQGARPRPRGAQPLASAARTRCVTRFGWRPGSARRSRCRCCAGRRCRTAGTAPRASSGTPTGSSTRQPGSDGSTRSAGTPAPGSRSSTRRLRVVDTPVPAVASATRRSDHARRRRSCTAARPRSASSPHPSSRRSPAAAPTAPPLPPLWRPAPAAHVAAAPAAGDEITDVVVGIVAEMTGYPRRSARPRPGPRGRPRRRHRQAGRGLRRRPRPFGVERDDTLSCATSRPCATSSAGSAAKTGTPRRADRSRPPAGAHRSHRPGRHHGAPLLPRTRSPTPWSGSSPR